MSRPLQMEFLVAAPDVAVLPDTRAEIAFVGRSNVGKSSLLNAIGGSKKLAPVSKTPGRTQVLNCFALERTGATIVDCPGYGYAKVPKSTRLTWLPMLEAYLLGRENLAMVLLLVDGEIGPTDSDLGMLAWLRDHTRPHSVIATKLDKVKASRLAVRQQEVAARCMLAPSDVLWVSASRDIGIPRLREAVREWLKVR